MSPPAGLGRWDPVKDLETGRQSCRAQRGHRSSYQRDRGASDRRQKDKGRDGGGDGRGATPSPGPSEATAIWESWKRPGSNPLEPPGERGPISTPTSARRCRRQAPVPRTVRRCTPVILCHLVRVVTESCRRSRSNGR